MEKYWIPLVQWSRELRKLTGRPIAYNTCYRACLDGRVPAEKRGREWGTADGIKAVAIALGLIKQAA